VDPRPGPAEKTQNCFTITFVAGTNRNIAGNAGTLHGLTFGHAKRNAACHLRSGWLKSLRSGTRSRRSRRWRAGVIAGNRPDLLLGGGCLRGRGRRGALAVGAYQIFRANRTLRAETGICRAGTRPVGLGEEINRLGEPAAFVLILKDLRRIRAT